MDWENDAHVLHGRVAFGSRWQMLAEPGSMDWLFFGGQQQRMDI